MILYIQCRCWFIIIRYVFIANSCLYISVRSVVAKWPVPRSDPITFGWTCFVKMSARSTWIIFICLLASAFFGPAVCAARTSTFKRNACPDDRRFSQFQEKYMIVYIVIIETVFYYMLSVCFFFIQKRVRYRSHFQLKKVYIFPKCEL